MSYVYLTLAIVSEIAAISLQNLLNVQWLLLFDFLTKVKNVC